MINDIKIGIDIQDINSFIKKPFPKNERLYRRLFTPKEINHCLSKINPYIHFAVRFAGKEALIKCISHITNVRFKNIEILNDESGKPYIHLLNLGSTTLKEENFRLSLSHSNEYASAIVIYLV